MKFTRFLELLEIHNINPDNIVLSSDFIFNDPESNTNYELLFEDGNISKLENNKDDKREDTDYVLMSHFTKSRRRGESYQPINIISESSESIKEINPTIEDLQGINPPTDPNEERNKGEIDPYEYHTFMWEDPAMDLKL